jgi:hypothetical protein
MVIHSSFEDFLLFLYVHISQSDNAYDPKELKVIQEKMKDLYPSEVDFEKKMYTTLRAYNTFDRSKMPELTESSLKHFRTNNADKKLKIITDLLDIINADGKVEDNERAALNALNKTINSYL